MVTATYTIEIPMAKKASNDGPGTETVRVHADIAEMLREIIFFSRDESGKRIKMTALVDSLIRQAVLREHAKVMKKVQAKKDGEE